MILKNAQIFDQNFEIAYKDISIEGNKIGTVGENLCGDNILDLSGCMIAPGFVDIHIHGCVDADTCDLARESIAKMAAHLVQKGVTSFCPTTMTVSLPQIESMLLTIRNCMDNPPEGATVRGANMEGPYISLKRLGAHRAEYVRRPDWKEFQRLYDKCGGIIRIVDIASECEGSEEFIRHVSKYCRVSLAHTEACFEQANKAFDSGITHITHLFNAMSGMNHRTPGVVGAIFDNKQVTAEIICDGFHIHPAVLRTAFRILGEDRMVIISDSMRAAGMPDGEYELGGQQVVVMEGKAHLTDGTIAGSTTNLLDEVKNLVRFGIPIRQVMKSATLNPAKVIGADKEIGSIESGKQADLIVLDKELNPLLVFVGGKVAINRM